MLDEVRTNAPSAASTHFYAPALRPPPSHAGNVQPPPEQSQSYAGASAGAGPAGPLNDDSCRTQAAENAQLQLQGQVLQLQNNVELMKENQNLLLQLIHQMNAAVAAIAAN
jgi:hypothetical protein